MVLPPTTTSTKARWEFFDPDMFAQDNGIPIFSIGFDKLLGCFVRLRGADGEPDLVGVGLRDDLDHPNAARLRRSTLLHELGHWATTTGLLLPVAGFHETYEQLTSDHYMRSKAEEAADRWAMKMALGVAEDARPAERGAIAEVPLLFQEMLIAEQVFGPAQVQGAAYATQLPPDVIARWARRCEKLGIFRGSNWAGLG